MAGGNDPRKMQTPQRPRQRSGLSKGRPPNAHKQPSAMKSKATRNLINQIHRLQKSLAKAEANGDDKAAEESKKQIAALGGLDAYQSASIQGQANDRGGDSSTVLLDFLQDVRPALASTRPRPRLLEIGALSTKNACSRSGLFEITRIDLSSQADGIVQQDFMQRPEPQSDRDKFELISLSLVLNFVPDAAGRGAMLARTTAFLNEHIKTRAGTPAALHDTLLPALFLVLPAPCVTNSRYLTEERLTRMMASLGYVSVRRKQSSKLLYTLWRLRDPPVPGERRFAKTLVNPGAGRNNFSIVL